MVTRAIRTAVQAYYILKRERAAQPTITPRPLPVEMMEMTVDEANSGVYDDWLDKQADVVLHEPDFLPGTQWDDVK